MKPVAICLLGVLFSGVASCNGEPAPGILAPSAAPRPVPEVAAPPARPRAAFPEQSGGFDSYLVALSLDGRSALLEQLGSRPSQLHYRVMALDGGRIEADLPLPALSKLPLETLSDGGREKNQDKIHLRDPALEADLKAISPHLARFPLGAGGRVAASFDGKRAALNVGDRLHVAVAGKIGAAVTSAAAYAPWFTPDGSHLLFRRHDPAIVGTNPYELAVMALEGPGAPKRVPNTAGITDGFAINASGDGVRFVVHTGASDRRACVMELPFAAPSRAARKLCLEGAEKLSGCILSPHGSWVACNTSVELPEDDPKNVIYIAGKRTLRKKQVHRFRIVNVDRGAITFDVERTPQLEALSDEGLLLSSRSHQTTLFDSALTEIADLEPPLHGLASAKFRTGNELVISRDGLMRRAALSEWKRVPPVEAR